MVTLSTGSTTKMSNCHHIPLVEADNAEAKKMNKRLDVSGSWVYPGLVWSGKKKGIKSQTDVKSAASYLDLTIGWYCLTPKSTKGLIFEEF